MNLPKTRHMFPASEPARLDGNELTVKCPECGKTFTKHLTPKEAGDVILVYEGGGFHPRGHVQDVFPHPWTCAERELFLMSHVCGPCWDSMFGVEEPDGSDADGDGEPRLPPEPPSAGCPDGTCPVCGGRLYVSDDAYSCDTCEYEWRGA